jgi:uncharacterized alkaline shock family protein YloU
VAVAVAEQPDDAGRATDPAHRGGLTIRDKVVDRVASYAAATTPGVVRHASGLDRVTGRDLPRTDVTVAGGHVRAQVHVAVAWPQSLPTVTAAVRSRVTEQLRSLVGLVVDAVDVSVPVVALAESASEVRRIE